MDQEETHILENWTLGDIDDKGKPIAIGLPPRQMLLHVQRFTKGWPKAVGKQLFFQKDGELREIDCADKFFAWLMTEGMTIAWNSNARNAITQAAFFNYVQINCSHYQAIELIPHYPRMDNVYYMLPKKTEALYQGTLTTLLKMFNPASTNDYTYLKALFLTLGWGGPCGARPAFVLLGPDEDKDGGRGVGKTAITDVLSMLYGGGIDFDPKDNRESITKRLLTARTSRLIRIDNVKGKIASSAIESMITARSISGHKMYVGDDSVPNYYTWVITFNMPEFSKDMAQRAIPIRLSRPTYKPTWWPKVEKWITANRWRVLWDIERILQSEPVCIFEKNTRFSEWDSAVLAHCSTNKLQAEDLLNRQYAMEDEEPLMDQFYEIIVDHLSRYRFDGGMNGTSLDLDNCCYRVKRSLIVGWILERAKWMSSKSIIKCMARDRPDWLIMKKKDDEKNRDTKAAPKGDVTLSVKSKGIHYLELGAPNVNMAWLVQNDSRADSYVRETVRRRGVSLVTDDD